MVSQPRFAGYDPFDALVEAAEKSLRARGKLVEIDTTDFYAGELVGVSTTNR